MGPVSLCGSGPGNNYLLPGGIMSLKWFTERCDKLNNENYELKKKVHSLEVKILRLQDKVDLKDQALESSMHYNTELEMELRGEV